MGAYFSSIDNDAITQEGNACNHFLSLVVDTRGTYVARVTRRLTTTKNITATVQETLSYPTYNGREVVIETKEPTVQSGVQTTTKLIAYNLKVEVTKVTDAIPEEWITDLNEARKKHYTQNAYVSPSFMQQPTYPTQQPAAPLNTSGHKVSVPIRKDPGLFDEIPEFEETKYPLPQPTSEDLEETAGKLIDDQDVEYMVAQIVSGNLFISKDAINNINQYAVTLPGSIKRVFGRIEEYLPIVTSFIEALVSNYQGEHNCLMDAEEIFNNVLLEKLDERLSMIPHSNEAINAIRDTITTLYL